MAVLAAADKFSNTRKVRCVAPDKSNCYVEVSEVYMKRHGAAGRTNKLVEYWSLIVGVKPPMNNIGKHENFKEFPLSGMKDAHALYRGIKRGCNENSDGSDVFIYLIKPQYHYELIPDMVCMAKCSPVPDDWILAVYVRFADQEDNDGVSGTIIDWHFVRAQGHDKMKPCDESTRYEERIW